MENDFDVAIFGSGIGGTMLASILARHGVKTIILDWGTHPRFAIGESTAPEASLMHTLLSLKFDVPELHEIGLASPGAIRKKVGSTCGIKRTIGFAYHSINKQHNLKEAIQFGNFWRDENHLFRQDIDSYFLQVAVRYGATILQNIKIENISIKSTGVQLQTNQGEFFVQYVVDGSGFSSVLAKQFGLRDTPPRIKHHSRTIFTHMIDVTPFDQCTENPFSVPWLQGTLHHIFKGGWLWVIPFNNWEGSTNQLVSVGLTLDPRVYPAQDTQSPQEEFFDFLARFPTVAKQFKNAKAIRPWIRTPRLQYSSHQTVGQRYCLTAHAASFVDPLFSRGLINNAEVINILAEALIPAIKENDYSIERFSHLEKLQERLLQYTDHLIEGSFISWSNFEVWNAWMRVWLLASGLVDSNLGSHIVMYNFPKIRYEPLKEYMFSPFEDIGYKDYFTNCYQIICQYRDKKLPPEDTVEALFKELREYKFSLELPNRSTSHYWALRNPRSRDLFIGKPELHERWEMKQDDPHLA